MANNNSPFGFQPSLIADVENQYANYTITSGYGSNIYIGDPVFISGGVNGSANLHVSTTPGQKLAGFFMGVTWTNPDGYVRRTNYWPSGQVATNIVASVSDNPFSRYKVQLNGAYLDCYLGQLADFAVGTGSLVSGSGYVLDVATVGTGTGFLITDVFAAPSNADTAYAIVEVVPMKQIYRS
jgi:hypothetical protein